VSKFHVACGFAFSLRCMCPAIKLDQGCKRASFWRPNPARRLFLKPDVGTKVKITEWVKTFATAGYWWRSKVNMTEYFTIIFWRLLDSIASTLTGDRSVRSLRKHFHAGPKSARNISSSQNPAGLPSLTRTTLLWRSDGGFTPLTSFPVVLWCAENELLAREHLHMIKFCILWEKFGHPWLRPHAGRCLPTHYFINAGENNGLSLLRGSGLFIHLRIFNFVSWCIVDTVYA